MNLNTLEKLARQMLKGNDVADKSSTMLTPAEHRSLKSLSWQIAANVQANGSSKPTVTGTYMLWA
jgi:hypothetical protein